MPGARERARQAMARDIVEEGRRQLALVGAAALSLRSVARELGVVSSAVYRYVASRDELLTLLIVEAYDELADAIEAVPASRSARITWRERCRAVRAWARDHPHDYALLYGSPVPGYAAPVDTIGPATRVYAALLAPLAHAAPTAPARSPASALPRRIRADAERAAAALALDVPPATMARAHGAIASLFGVVSFELFGHTNNVITDHAAFFDLHVAQLADDLNL